MTDRLSQILSVPHLPSQKQPMIARAEQAVALREQRAMIAKGVPVVDTGKFHPTVVDSERARAKARKRK